MEKSFSIKVENLGEVSGAGGHGGGGVDKPNGGGTGGTYGGMACGHMGGPSYVATGGPGGGSGGAGGRGPLTVEELINMLKFLPQHLTTNIHSMSVEKIPSEAPPLNGEIPMEVNLR